VDKGTGFSEQTLHAEVFMAGRMRLSAVVTCGLAVSCAIGLPARADTTLNSGTTTLSTGTDFGATLSVGTTGTATLAVVAGGSATAATAYLGSTATGNGTVTVSGGTLACTSQLWIGERGTGTLNVSGGFVNSPGSVWLGDYDGSAGTAVVTSGTWAASVLTVGQVTQIPGRTGIGTLTLSGGLVTVASSLNKGSFGTINLNAGGNLQIGVGGASGALAASLTNSGTLSFDSTGDTTSSGAISGTGTVLKRGAGVTMLSGSSSNTGPVTIEEGTLQLGVGGTSGGLGVCRVSVFAGGTLAFNRSDATTFSGTIVGSGAVVKRGAGTLTLSKNSSHAGGTTIQAGVLQVGAGGTTGSIQGSVVTNASLAFNRSDAVGFDVSTTSGTGEIANVGSGTTTLTGRTTYTLGLTAQHGRLIVGSTASLNGFATTGYLTAASGATLELRSRGLASVQGLSTLAGGTILAANGIAFGSGANVVGAGTISGRVAAASGSRLEADGGTLIGGDALSYAGFSSDGELYSNANEVQLLDRNEAVLGSLTHLGDGSGGGTLRAANGMLLEQGKNLTGRGTVYGNFINQGHVYGDGAAGGQTIVFAAGSTVSGIGSFENVVFSGTYAPGNSPAITSLAGGQFSSSSALVIELGGLQPGTQYDRVVDSGSLNLLGGALDVMVFNGFVPALGDSFEILQYGQLSGDFGMASYPALGSGLSWERTTSATAMTITVVPEPSVSWLTFVSLAFGGCAMRMCRGERFYEQVLRPTVHCPEDTSH